LEEGQTRDPVTNTKLVKGINKLKIGNSRAVFPKVPDDLLTIIRLPSAICVFKNMYVDVYTFPMVLIVVLVSSPLFIPSIIFNHTVFVRISEQNTSTGKRDTVLWIGYCHLQSGSHSPQMGFNGILQDDNSRSPNSQNIYWNTTREEETRSVLLFFETKRLPQRIRALG
jgi:hypothetical protein